MVGSQPPSLILCSWSYGLGLGQVADWGVWEGRQPALVQGAQGRGAGGALRWERTSRPSSWPTLCLPRVWGHLSVPLQATANGGAGLEVQGGAPGLLPPSLDRTRLLSLPLSPRPGSRLASSTPRVGNGPRLLRSGRTAWSMKVVCAPGLLSELLARHGLIQGHIPSSLARAGRRRGSIGGQTSKQGPGHQGQAGCGLGLRAATKGGGTP